MDKSSALIADSPAEAVKKRKREIEEENGEGQSQKKNGTSQKKD
jgi:hypothetical protein